ncbi:VOC family protein [Streptomyces sp. NBC_01446]|uniref:Glyoxalase-like domain-containing protein n=1 Tax=Streptomyces sp. NBC_00119 TaxID=2975659 RepID=A0AAU1UL14_9ACTN|nr:VOC family protein [Streptomyces sp. NBC_01446]MCX4649728.1 hypothetical protein [Streptomyces sp. NBC_01446]
MRVRDPGSCAVSAQSRSGRRRWTWSPPRESEAWQALHHADSIGRALGLMRSTSQAEPRPRLHLNLFTDTTEEQEAEVQQLVSLGAWLVLADPDGNLFCVVDLSAQWRQPVA